MNRPLEPHREHTGSPPRRACLACGHNQAKWSIPPQRHEQRREAPATKRGRHGRWAQTCHSVVPDLGTHWSRSNDLRVCVHPVLDRDRLSRTNFTLVGGAKSPGRAPQSHGLADVSARTASTRTPDPRSARTQAAAVAPVVTTSSSRTVVPGGGLPAPAHDLRDFAGAHRDPNPRNRPRRTRTGAPAPPKRSPRPARFSPCGRHRDRGRPPARRCRDQRPRPRPYRHQRRGDQRPEPRAQSPRATLLEREHELPHHAVIGRQSLHRRRHTGHLEAHGGPKPPRQRVQHAGPGRRQP